jgi:hypothetical protein
MEFIPKFFNCDICDYTTRNKKDFSKHLLTRKHIYRTNLEQTKSPNTNECQITNNLDKKSQFSCRVCNKTYKARNSLWYHEKTCNVIHKQDTQCENKQETDELIKEVLKQNQEFKELIAEQNNKILELSNKPIVINNSTTNKFNLNVFLNEQCKDAVNIMDFVKSLQIELSELESVGKLGYAEGISKIFIKGLKELDVYKRPIHCSDLKRETLYVKDQNAWEKENEDKTKIKQAIKQIEHKNIKNIPDWINQHPDSKYADSPKNDQYMRIISNSMGGATNEEDEKNYNKIIKKLATEVLISK